MNWYSILHESHARHCAVSRGKFQLVLSYFIVSFNQTQNSFKSKENAWFLYIWKCNTSFMVDLNPLVKGGACCHFLQVWKLLSPYKQDVILSGHLSGCWVSLWRSQSREESQRKPQCCQCWLSFLEAIKKGFGGDPVGTKWYWGKWKYTSRKTVSKIDL